MRIGWEVRTGHLLSQVISPGGKSRIAEMFFLAPHKHLFVFLPSPIL